MRIAKWDAANDANAIMTHQCRHHDCAVMIIVMM